VSELRFVSASRLKTSTRELAAVPPEKTQMPEPVPVVAAAMIEGVRGEMGRKGKQRDKETLDALELDLQVTLPAVTQYPEVAVWRCPSVLSGTSSERRRRWLCPCWAVLPFSESRSCFHNVSASCCQFRNASPCAVPVHRESQTSKSEAHCTLLSIVLYVRCPILQRKGRGLPQSGVA